MFERRFELLKLLGFTVRVDLSWIVIAAMEKMTRTGASGLLVLENGRLASILSLKDFVRFLPLKVELEDGESVAKPAIIQTAGTHE